MNMTDCIWEPLAEIELNLCGPENFRIYCLCSRAFIRNKVKVDSWEELFNEKLEQFEIDDEPMISVCDPEGHNLELQGSKKLEGEAVSCYCSASHYSTDDYESVMQSASDHPNTNKDQLAPCPLQNSDSGADLSENFVEKPCCGTSEHMELGCQYFKSKLDIAWEKYWSEYGESIIWKSWIEKYGAYINPNYLEQNSICENFDPEFSNVIQEDCARESEIKRGNSKDDEVEDSSAIESVEAVTIKEKNVKEAVEKIPHLKISSYSSCSNLSEVGDSIKTNVYIDDLDPEDKILKSNSFGSYASYEKVRFVGADEEKLKNSDHERVRSRCSNTNLSVKSMANTTVTTDSMTNVTKITLSSLDLSCEYESVRSSSLFSSSSEDSSGPSSSSSSSSREEICTEADMWWRKVWKEHYQDQYTNSYQTFSDNFCQDNDVEAMETKLNAVQAAKQELLNKIDEQVEVSESNNVFSSQKYFNSVGYLLQRLDKANMESEQEIRNEPVNKDVNVADCEIREKSKSPVGNESLKRHLENSDNSFDEDCEEVDSRCKKRISEKKSHENEDVPKRGKSARKMDNIKQAMALMGYSFKSDTTEIQSGYVTYRKKNIRAQNRRLKLYDTKPRTHLFFDDDGNPFEARQNDLDDMPKPLPEVCDDEHIKLGESFVEPESLGYEAHSSSIEDGEDMIDESKKQKKKRKRQRKYNNLPQEIVENKNLLKYWLRRYQLFSKFDSGIKLDSESWYSVTPEKLARHHAERCRCDVLIDAFCGAGGNSIQFAFTCERVIAIDIDPEKIEMAKHNAKIYGVEDRIEFIVGDFTKLASKLQADVVFLSPPWGGPEYINHDVYNLENILPPLGGEELFRLASAIAEDIAYFLPKNVDSVDLTLLSGPGGEVEIEQNFMDQRLRSVTAYFGGLIKDADDLDDAND